MYEGVTLKKELYNLITRIGKKMDCTVSETIELLVNKYCADEKINDSVKEIRQAYQEGYRHGFSEGMRTQLSEIWIPVERRKPRYDNPVLVTYRNRVEIAWYGKDGQWYDGQCGLEKTEVTAWLGLPDPYGCEE